MGGLRNCTHFPTPLQNYASQIQIHRIKMRIALDIGTHKVVPPRGNMRKLQIAYL